MKDATAILLRRYDGQVLGATRRGTTDQWGLIGGKVDEGEAVYAAALREFREETGVELRYLPKLVFIRPCEAGPDGRVFRAYTYQVDTQYDIDRVSDAFKEPREVEPGILVGFVPFEKLLQGPFALYNAALKQKLGI